MKQILFAVALMLLSVPAFAGNTYFVYGGGLNISRQDLTAPVTGLFSFPIVGLTGSLVSYNFDTNEMAVSPEAGLSGALVFGDCKAEPDTITGGIDFTPQGFLLGVDAGGGMFQQAPSGNTWVGKGFAGLCVFDPKDFGNMGVAVNQTFGEQFNPTAWLLWAQSFDVLGGVPVTKLH